MGGGGGDPISSFASEVGKGINNVGSWYKNNLDTVTGEKQRQAEKEAKQAAKKAEEKQKNLIAKQKAEMATAEKRADRVKARNKAKINQSANRDNGINGTILTPTTGGTSSEGGVKNLLGL